MKPVDETVLARWAWDQQAMWSKAADKVARSCNRARLATLLLTVAAAVLVTASALKDLNGIKPFLVWGAVVCTSLVALTQSMISPGKTHERMRVRSVSESLKSAVYTYLAGVAPYRGPDREETFRRNVDGVVASAADLADRIIGIHAGTKALPDVHDVDSYINVRLKTQVNKYYRPKSMQTRRRAQWFRAAGTALAVLAALVSASAAIPLDGWASWLPVITTASAAVAAHAGVQRYAVLAVEYARTAAELERLVRDRQGPLTPSEAAEDTFVAAAEKAIAQQNEAWMARGLAATENAGLPRPPSIPRPEAA